MRIAIVSMLAVAALHAGAMKIPDEEVLDQNGRKLHFYSDLVKGKVVAVNFVFTTCTTICPPMGATFASLRKSLGERAGRDVNLISISVDAVNDTPQRLKAWSEKFGAGPGWTLITGDKPTIDRLLKSFQAYTPKLEHSSLSWVGNDATGEWTRIDTLASASKLAEAIAGVSKASAAQQYFSDVVLLDQDGKSRRFYTDLIKGKVVVINVFFTSCEGSCPVMAATFNKLQNWYGDRIGKDLFLVSLSVDPDKDTPEKLKAYAGRFGSRPGWTFVTGQRENLNTALRKLGQYVEQPDDHSTVFLIGNEPTGLWKKAMGLAKPEEIIRVIDSVLNDAK
jgi:protein SCO1/2